MTGNRVTQNRVTRNRARIARWSCGGLGPARRAEILGHIDDAEAAGVGLSRTETLSICAMGARARTIAELPSLVAALPLALLAFVAYGYVYSEHFAPWDLMEEIPSTDPKIAALRSAAELAWVVVLPLGLYAGWRAARRVRRHAYRLAGAYVAAVLVMVGQARLFIERTEWFAQPLEPSHVDAVSPYSASMLAIAVGLPAMFIILDALFPAPAQTAPTRVDDHRSDPADPASGPDLTALLALATPGLFVVIAALWVLPFTALTWLSDSFSRRQKMTATIVAVAPLLLVLAYVVATGDPDGDGLSVIGLLLAATALQLATWLWLAGTVLRLHRTPPDRG